MSRGRVRKALSGFYYVDVDGREVTCRARGKFRQEGKSPLVGDWVEVLEDERGQGTVWEIEPRRNAFQRPAAANVDQLVAVASLIVDCAMRRNESRGLHFNTDYPGKLDHRFVTQLHRW